MENGWQTPAKTLVTAVCRNVCKKIALVSKFFQPVKPRRPSEITRFVATSTARADWLTIYRRIWAVQIGKCLSTKGPVSSVVVCHVGLPTGVNHVTIQPAGRDRCQALGRVSRGCLFAFALPCMVY